MKITLFKMKPNLRQNPRQNSRQKSRHIWVERKNPLAEMKEAESSRKEKKPRYVWVERKDPFVEEEQELLRLSLLQIFDSPLLEKHDSPEFWGRVLSTATDLGLISSFLFSIIYSIPHLTTILLKKIIPTMWNPSQGMVFMISPGVPSNMQIPEKIGRPDPKGPLDLSILILIENANVRQDESGDDIQSDMIKFLNSLKISNILLSKYLELYGPQTTSPYQSHRHLYPGLEKELPPYKTLIDLYDSSIEGSGNLVPEYIGKFLAEYSTLIGDFDFITGTIRTLFSTSQPEVLLSDKTSKEINAFGLEVSFFKPKIFYKKFVEECLFYIFYLDDYAGFVRYWDEHLEDLGMAIIERLNKWDVPPYSYLGFIAQERKGISSEKYESYIYLLDHIKEDEIKERWQILLGYDVDDYPNYHEFRQFL